MKKSREKQIKAKTKNVKYANDVEDKKILKKVSAQKKAVRKKVVKKRKTNAKTKTKKCKKKIAMDELYSIINKVQLGRKKITFATDIIDAIPIEHTIQDAEVEYDKVQMKTQVVFTLRPSSEPKYEDNILDHIDIMEDEIPDLNQIFP